MYILYGSLLGMLFLAIGLFVLFYYRHKHLFTFSKFLLLSFFITVFSAGIYFLTRHTDEIQKWYVYGQRQYQFLMDYERLGGISGMIDKIHAKLEDNPKDVNTWVVLGKLYLAQLDYVPAGEAFQTALDLQPDNADVKHYLEISKEPYKYLRI